MRLSSIGFLLVCLACSSCTTANQSQVESKTYQIYAYPVAASQPAEHVVVVFQTSQAYKTMAAFKAFMASLPKGSYVDWDTGCIRFTHLPVGSEKISVEALKTFAKSKGITFRYTFGW
jgi:hypothetical protein